MSQYVPDEEICYFPCFQCARRVFLIRGLCDTCAPALHRNYQERLDAFVVADERFFRATGKHALQDWYGFEAFCLRLSDEWMMTRALQACRREPLPPLDDLDEGCQCCGHHFATFAAYMDHARTHEGA